MENFARVISALYEYSMFNLMQNALDFIQTWTKLPLSFMPVRARKKATSFSLFFFFFFLTNKDPLQLFCSNSCALLSMCWIIKQLSCSILWNIAWFKPTRPRRLRMRRYSARFRRIIVKYLRGSPVAHVTNIPQSTHATHLSKWGVWSFAVYSTATRFV